MDPFIGIQTANRSSKQGRAIQRWRPGLEGDTWTVTDTAGSSIEGGDEWRAVGVGREPKGEMERSSAWVRDWVGWSNRRSKWVLSMVERIVW